ncbi:MAG: HDOD domain-containing protein [Planctomycetes bacterium]|nr:HDOD domain-containing protein [Planctomycetota bacterium]
MSSESESILKRVERIEDLPTLPHIFNKLQQMLKDPETTAKDVGAVLMEDPSLASKLLKIANSAYYGLSHEVRTISHAVVVLGYNSLRSMILGSAVVGLFKPPKRTFQGFDRQDFWVHSVAVGAAARVLARKTRKHDPEEAFIAGLVHDIGKLILDFYFPEEFEKVLSYIAKNDAWIYDAELAVLGVSHCRIAQSLLGKWGLPEVLVDSVVYHHDVESASDKGKPLAAIVHIADIIARTLTLGSGGDLTIPARNDAAIKILGISDIEIDLIVAEASTEAEKASIFLENEE